MDNLIAIAFEAHHAERNHHRRYSIVIGRDLLDDWTVRICYGRIGGRGREQRIASHQSDELRTIVRDRLQRRLTAPRRIGCEYRLKEWSTGPGVDAGYWLPDDLMVRFFSPLKSAA
jgi:hypothetical protein